MPPEEPARRLAGSSAIADFFLANVTRRSPSASTLYATNPSIVHDSGLVLLRVTPCSYCTEATLPICLSDHRVSSKSFVAIARRGEYQPAHYLRGLEDPKALIAHRTLYILANRYVPGRTAGIRRGLGRMSAWASSTNQMGLVRFSYPELVPKGSWQPLKYSAARQREKNWVALAEVPAASPGDPLDGHPRSSMGGPPPPPDLLVSYSVEPHVVLRCTVIGLECAMEHNTSAASLFRRRLGGGSMVGRLLMYSHNVRLDELRGGSSCARMPRRDVTGLVPPGLDGLVCIGHWHNDFSLYMHFMYLVENVPPYRVTAVSYPFRFRRFFDDERDRVQFAAGTAVDEASGILRISFGIADCVASETAIPTPDVAAMLRGDLVVPRL